MIQHSQACKLKRANSYAHVSHSAMGKHANLSYLDRRLARWGKMHRLLRLTPSSSA